MVRDPTILVIGSTGKSGTPTANRAVSLNPAERICVYGADPAHSDGNRSRNDSRSLCASATRPRIRTRLSGGRFSSSMPRSHRRSHRFSMEPTSSSSSAISPSRRVSNSRACATSAGCTGRVQASARRETRGTQRGCGAHTGSGAAMPTSREIDNTHRYSPMIDSAATPQVHRTVKFRTVPVTVHSLRVGRRCEVLPPSRLA
jgi:hypothetical protein